MDYCHTVLAFIKVRLIVSAACIFPIPYDNHEVAMRFPLDFLLKIARAGTAFEHGNEKMFIIVLRPYNLLEDELRETIKGQEDVQVIVDRRYGERRTSRQAVEVERRLSEQRRPKEGIVDVVLAA